MKKILIIDDEAGLRQVLCILLTREQYEVSMAEDGEQGLELMTSFRPQIVILDLNMPNLGGIDFLKQLHPDYNRGHAIIVLTGFGTDDDVRTCYQLGINSFLRKPVNIPELLGLIKRNLELIHFSEQLKREKIEKENAYRLIKKSFDSMPDGVITLDSDFVVQMISRKACQILGITLDECLKKPAASLLGNTVAGPSGILMDYSKDQTEATDCLTHFQLTSGTIVPVYLTLKPLKKGKNGEGWLLLFREKREVEGTAQKEIDSEKENTYQLLKQTFDSMSEGVITIDPDFLVQVISRKACQILRVTPNKCLKKPAVSLLGSTVAGPSGILMDYIKGQTAAIDYLTHFQLENDTIVPVYLTIKPLKRENSGEGWLLLFRERSEAESADLEQTDGVAFGRMISMDHRMLEIFQVIDKIAPSNVTVLIGGESGTGKELVAREIHDRSLRSQKAFQAVNCAAIPINLIESELFGHERGAFTDAVRTKRGLFELADGGTVFLDEIGDMPLEMQAKLLRVLQEHTFERVGGTNTLHVDVRLIAATNRNLQDLISKRLFREDLFYRLEVISLQLPPLRERIQDIPLLVSHFIKQLNKVENRHIQRFSSKVSSSLLSYSWPGNVRELLHVVESAFAISQGNSIHYEHLPKKLQSVTMSAKNQENMRKYEKNILIQSLKQVSYNKKKAANLLGISQATLYRKIKKYKL